MRDIYIGWDVGGWHCEHNQNSRDALCAVGEEAGELQVIGQAWSGNTREILAEAGGRDPLPGLLDLLTLPASPSTKVTLAINAPLGWPQAALELLRNGTTVDVPESAANNPYHYRRQERTLYAAGGRPPSVIRDMLGSQSLKGLHFLSRAGFRRADIGVFAHRRKPLSAIETDPGEACRRAPELAQLADDLLDDAVRSKHHRRTTAWRRCVRDAIVCATIAHRFETTPHRLEQPPTDSDPAEGWIWLPVPDAPLPVVRQRQWR